MCDVTVFEINDEVGAAFLEADHYSVVDNAPGEHGAAAGARLEGDEVRDLDIFDATLCERVNDLLALPFAIGRRLDMLKCTTTAGAEVFARRSRAGWSGRQDFRQAGAVAHHFRCDDVAGHGEGNIETFSSLAVATMAQANDLFARQWCCHALKPMMAAAPPNAVKAVATMCWAFRPATSYCFCWVS